MRSIAIINQKGGVGKTTTAVNLGAALARMGNRVCLIDLDPQAHASLHLGLSLDDDAPSVYHVLTGPTRVAEILQSVDKNLWIVPAHIDLAAAEMELAGEVGREIILRDKLAELSRDPAAPAFDYMIIDCPPSLGVLTLNALSAMSEVILPLQPHFLALHGLSKLLRTIEIVAQRLNPALRLTGVVFCMYDANTRLAGEVCSDVDEFFASAASQGSPWAGARAFKTRIRRNVRLAEAPSYGQSIFQYAASSPGAEDYLSMAKEVVSLAAASTSRRRAG